MSQYYTVIEEETRKLKKFNLKKHKLLFKLNPVPQTEDPVSWVKNGIQAIFEKSVEDLNPEDRVGFTFSSNDPQKGDGWIRLQPARNITFNDMWNMLSSIFQSNSSGINTDTFCLESTCVKLPEREK